MDNGIIKIRLEILRFSFYFSVLWEMSEDVVFDLCIILPADQYRALSPAGDEADLVYFGI